MKDMFNKDLNIGDHVLVMHRDNDSSQYITTGVVTGFKKLFGKSVCVILSDHRYFNYGVHSVGAYPANVRDTEKSVYKINFNDEEKEFIMSLNKKDNSLLKEV